MKYNSSSVVETKKISQEIVDDLKAENVILLQGELGAGKTTFSQSVLEFLGAKGPFTSPTFVIMKKYDLGKLQSTSASWRTKFSTIYHFDCYRVGSKDVLDLGWEEIISDPKNLVLVEWPERIKEIWPERYVKIDFKSLGENQREIKID